MGMIVNVVHLIRQLTGALFLSTDSCKESETLNLQKYLIIENDGGRVNEKRKYFPFIQNLNKEKRLKETPPVKSKAKFKPLEKRRPARRSSKSIKKDNN